MLFIEFIRFLFFATFNILSANAQVGKYYHYLGTSDKIPPALVPIALPIAQQQQQKESQSNGFLKPLKLSKPITLKSEIASQIPSETTVGLTQESFPRQNQIKPLSYKFNKNKIREFNKNSLIKPLTGEQQYIDSILKSKSFQDIKSPNSLLLFEPESPLSTYKTKLINNAKSMLSTTKPTQRERQVTLKAVSKKNKKNDKKKEELDMNVQIESTTLSELNETHTTNSKPINNFNLSSNQEFVNSIKSFLGDLVTKIVEEKMELKTNQSDRENTLSAKKTKNVDDRALNKIEEFKNNFTESLRTAKDEEKNEDKVFTETYQRPIYNDEPFKKYKLILVDDRDFSKTLRLNPADRLSKIRRKKLNQVKEWEEHNHLPNYDSRENEDYFDEEPKPRATLLRRKNEMENSLEYYDANTNLKELQNTPLKNKSKKSFKNTVAPLSYTNVEKYEYDEMNKNQKFKDKTLKSKHSKKLTKQRFW